MSASLLNGHVPARLARICYGPSFDSAKTDKEAPRHTEGRYDGGPVRAVEEFLAERPGRYEIDTRFCDFDEDLAYLIATLKERVPAPAADDAEPAGTTPTIN